MNRKTCVILTLLFTVSCFLSFSAAAQSLEELRAQIRSEVRREMGVQNIQSREKEDKAAGRTEAEPDQKERDHQAALGIVIVTGVMITVFILIFGKRRKKRPANKSALKKAGKNAPEPEKSEEETREKPDKVAVDEHPETALDIYQKIERLQALREKGILSEQEFDDKKTELLSRI